MLARRDLARDSSPHFFSRLNSHLTEISPLISPRFWPPRFGEISARFWPPRFSSHRDLTTNLGAFLAAEIFISPRSRRVFGRRDLARSRRGFGRRDFHLTEISPLKSRRVFGRRDLARSRRVFGRRDFHLAEISPLISARFWPPRFGEISACFWPARFSSRRDLATNLGAFLAAEIWRDLGVFLAGEIFISPRSRH